jgi:hypothetical protein
MDVGTTMTLNNRHVQALPPTLFEQAKIYRPARPRRSRRRLLRGKATKKPHLSVVVVPCYLPEAPHHLASAPPPKSLSAVAEDHTPLNKEKSRLLHALQLLSLLFFHVACFNLI